MNISIQRIFLVVGIGIGVNKRCWDLLPEHQIFFSQLFVCFFQRKIGGNVIGSLQNPAGNIVAGFEKSGVMVVVLNNEYEGKDFQEQENKCKIIPDYVGK